MDARIKHGHSGSPTYRCWRAMKVRCLTPTSQEYHRYGARGITVCERWLTFANFLADMGIKPRGLSLDRIDNNGNYEPSNCRWATIEQQNNNTRSNHMITAFGKTMTMMQWSREQKINWFVLWERIKAGWNAERALTQAVRKMRNNKLGRIAHG